MSSSRPSDGFASLREEVDLSDESLDDFHLSPPAAAASGGAQAKRAALSPLHIETHALDMEHAHAGGDREAADDHSPTSPPSRRSPPQVSARALWQCALVTLLLVVIVVLVVGVGLAPDGDDGAAAAPTARRCTNPMVTLNTSTMVNGRPRPKEEVMPENMLIAYVVRRREERERREGGRDAEEEQAEQEHGTSD